MNIGGEAQRMLFDARSFLPAPGRGGGSNAIGEEAVDDAGQKISQILSIVGDWNDLVPMRLVCNEGVDAVVGIHEPGNDPEAKRLLRASLAAAPAAMSAVPAESAVRWFSQAISGRRISTLMIRASARSISTSKPVRIGTPRL
jgi:hypothetical protein